MMIKFLALLGICIIGQLAISQTKNDPIYLNYNYFSPRELSEMDNKASLQMTEANIILPNFNLGKKTKVYTNINYKWLNLGYDENPSDLLPEDLHDVRIGLIARHELSENWELIFLPRLNIKSDKYKDLTHYDLFPSANLLALKKSKKIENLTWGLGVSHNNDVNKNAVIPLVFLQYENEAMRIFMVAPSFGYFMMTPTDKFEYGLACNLDSSIFHLKEPESDTENYLKISNITVTPAASYNIFKKFWINGKAGFAFSSNYQFLDAKLDPYEFSEDNKLKGGFFAAVGISLRVEEKAK